jgi:hypothetical protein
MKRLPFFVATLLFGASLAPAFALPELQLGPGSGSWSYDLVTGTWQGSGNPLELAAYANANTVDGGTGAYAWDSQSNTTRTAYLVISALPETTLNEPPSLFDVTVVNDAVALSLYGSGNGAPPLSDPNELAPHGIFPTYFEIYEFAFDGSLGTIGNVQPGQTCSGSCQGYTELFGISIDSMAASVTGLHFDLFTIEGDGQLNDTSEVYRNAPFTHDAETLPEPSAAVLLIGCAGFAWVGRRIRAR